MKYLLHIENIGLKCLAIFLGFLLWAYVHFIETGRIALISSISQ